MNWQEVMSTEQMRQPGNATAAFKILRSAVWQMKEEVHCDQSWNGDGR